MKARSYIKQLMAEAGLKVREDTMGNIFGVLPGANPNAAAVGTGSHCDAIPLAGMYDGTVGERVSVMREGMPHTQIMVAGRRPQRQG